MTNAQQQTDAERTHENISYRYHKREAVARHGDAATAAAAYGQDVRRMIRYDVERREFYNSRFGILREYARVAFSLAADALDERS